MYTTQMDAARQGVITEQLAAVAAREGVDPEKLRALVAAGSAVIPANKAHACLRPAGISRHLTTKINVNLGASRDCLDLDVEMQKVQAAVDMGAEAIMDLSNFGDTRAFRRKLAAQCPAVLGTVPIYDAIVRYNKALKDITADEWIDVVRMHAEDGVDFVTLHCGLNRRAAAFIKAHPRRTQIVSRGGSLIFAWMEMTGQENPFYERYDEVLDICEKHDVTLSLGDACRPGSLADASDPAQIQELIGLGELTERAWAHNVQVLVEGPGHMPMDQIAANMALQRSLCHDAPFYVLGPLVTDVAPGYDHITAAIGGAIAAMHGAAFLCYVTPAEHLRLPTVADVREGIVAARIAAHAADVAKGVPGARDWDDAMSRKRAELDWEGMFALAMDPDKARAYRRDSQPEREDTCTMCGKMCALRNMRAILRGEDVDAN
ncbi:MAG: phosphomethylpyrimidine synthase ThiC [Christensenellales bacterium]|jgi:phosphomethylpyrimidine synthase